MKRTSSKIVFALVIAVVLISMAIPASAAIVRVYEGSSDEFTFSINNVNEGSWIDITQEDMPERTARERSLRAHLKSIRMLPGASNPINAGVRFPSLNSGPSFDGEETVFLIYFHDLDDAELEQGEYEFGLRDRVFTDNNAVPDDLVVYRDKGDVWRESSHSYVEEFRGEHRFKVTDIDLGRYAVTLRQPTFETEEPEILQSEAGVGQEVNVEVVVRNTGTSDGEFRAELTTEGERLAWRDVLIGAGDTETVTLSHAFDEIGVYPLEFNGEYIGDVKISEDPPEDTGGEGDDDSEEQPGMGVIGGLVAALISALYVKSRQG